MQLDADATISWRCLPQWRCCRGSLDFGHDFGLHDFCCFLVLENSATKNIFNLLRHDRSRAETQSKIQLIHPERLFCEDLSQPNSFVYCRTLVLICGMKQPLDSQNNFAPTLKRSLVVGLQAMDSQCPPKLHLCTCDHCIWTQNADTEVQNQ